MFKYAKVVDKVWNINMGCGTIIDTNRNDKYPIAVKFTQEVYEYTHEGYEDVKDINPSIFWQKFEIPKHAFKKPLPNLKIDIKVIVWLDGKPKFKRYFKYFNEEGKIVTFQSGKTS